MRNRNLPHLSTFGWFSLVEAAVHIGISRQGLYREIIYGDFFGDGEVAENNQGVLVAVEAADRYKAGKEYRDAARAWAAGRGLIPEHVQGGAISPKVLVAWTQYNALVRDWAREHPNDPAVAAWRRENSSRVPATKPIPQSVRDSYDAAQPAAQSAAPARGKRRTAAAG